MKLYTIKNEDHSDYGYVGEHLIDPAAVFVDKANALAHLHTLNASIIKRNQNAHDRHASQAEKLREEYRAKRKRLQEAGLKPSEISSLIGSLPPKANEYYIKRIEHLINGDIAGDHEAYWIVEFDTVD